MCVLASELTATSGLVCILTSGNKNKIPYPDLGIVTITDSLSCLKPQTHCAKMGSSPVEYISFENQCNQLFYVFPFAEMMGWYDLGWVDQ